VDRLYIRDWLNQVGWCSKIAEESKSDIAPVKTSLRQDDEQVRRTVRHTGFFFVQRQNDTILSSRVQQASAPHSTRATTFISVQTEVSDRWEAKGRLTYEYSELIVVIQ
jgi:hypothetical protein